MMSDVSVIIAAYNVQAYIERAVRSALEQEGVTVEVIVVDDCSTDGTFAEVSGIKDARITLLSTTTNQGPSAARNVGFGLATAPWIAVLDGDDIFLPGRLTRLLHHAHRTRADVIVDNILIAREADGTSFSMFKSEWLSRLETLDLATFISKNQMFQPGYTLGYLKPLFSTDFLKKHRLTYDADIRIGEDYMLLARALFNRAHCSVESTPGYRYTVRANSISHRLSLTDIVRIQQGDQKFMSEFALDDASIKAQAKRSSSLEKAYAYTKLVAAIKDRSLTEIFEALKLRPSAALQLWEPIWQRVKKIHRPKRS